MHREEPTHRPLGATPSRAAARALVLCLALVTSASPAGADVLPVWTQSFPGIGAGTADTATAMGMDGAGRVTLVGQFANVFGGDLDLAVIRYLPGGTQFFQHTWNGPDDLDDVAADIHVAESGAFHVAATTELAEGGKAIVTLQYSATGVLQWAEIWDGSPGELDTATGIDVDDAGNVYVSGASADHGYTTLKYLPDGSLDWARHEGDGSASDVAADAQGVFVVGRTDDGGGSGSQNQARTVHYDTAGNLVWTATYFPAFGAGSASLSAIDLDPAGYVVVGGRTNNDFAETDTLVIQYDLAGSELWAAEGGQGGDTVTDLVVDGDGNVYTTGKRRAAVNFSMSSMYLNKRAADGSWLWTDDYGPSSGSQGRAVALGTQGPYITGVTCDQDFCFGGADLTTIAYDWNGNRRWISLEEGGAGADVVVGETGVFATGSLDGDFATMRYGWAFFELDLPLKVQFEPIQPGGDGRPARPQEIVLANPSKKAFRVARMQLRPKAACAAFDVELPQRVSIAPGAKLALPVRFEATESGRYACQLEIVPKSRRRAAATISLEARVLEGTGRVYPD